MDPSSTSTSSLRQRPAASASAPEPDPNDAPPNPPPEKPAGRRSMSDFVIRALSGFALTALFCLIVKGGHMWVGLGVVLMEVGMFNEILRLGFPVARHARIPLWRTTGWYFFVALQFLLYGKVVLMHFHAQSWSFTLHPLFQYLLHHHSFVSFCMYCAGFVGFVLSLRPDRYHFQFTYFGRALVALLLVVVQSHFMILNTSLGLIWFVLPSWLIIVNDSFAYFCGRLFGRHSLTPLSPKKTWEGYIGAAFFTMLFAYFFAGILARYPSLVCPREDFSDCYLFCPPVQCSPLPAPFIKTSMQLGPLHLTHRPVQWHAVALAAFAASIGPFGGFFASGAKRAFGIKDFGALLPGHGGVTDRVDCQLMMAVFTYVYLINFVRGDEVGSPDVANVLTFVTELSVDEQVDLLTELYLRLQRRGVTHLIDRLQNLTVT